MNVTIDMATIAGLRGPLMAKQVFLSYSTEDTSAATAVRDHLEAQGIACWMAPRDITPGKDYGEQIINAIEDATVFLLILSESANASTFVRHEVERAVSKGKVIIPFRIQPVQPSRSLEFFISNYQWIDGWALPIDKNWEALAAAIRNHLESKTTPPLASISSPQPAPSSVPSNLPHQLTPFVGRERELAALDELMGQRDVLLITILGQGGMGKTRLALTAAQGHLSDPHFRDGVYFVALAPLSDPQHIVLTLAEALSVSLLPSGAAHTPQQQLIEYLRSKQMLVLFDNFEHLLDGADLVAQILQAAPQVRVLATSRERLHIPGEHLFPIQGLDYNNANTHTSEGVSAAVQLFTQTARQIAPRWELNEEEVVTQICRLVGGMPLGIELAASWIELLSPAEIVAEIQRSLDFLEAERRGGQEQHRSVRAVFDSTWQRLEPAEQSVFARLAIFRGGFTREAAEEVAGASLRLLSALAGKSLIQHERGRYTLHELLRQFGEEKLLAVSQSSDETYELLCTYYTTYLQRQEARLKGRQQVEAMAAIEAELENIRTAWQWAVAHHQLEAIDRSLEALLVFYDSKSWYQEGFTVFGLAADSLQMYEPAGREGVVLGRILARQARMLVAFDFSVAGATFRENARFLCQRSLQIFETQGEHAETALSLYCLGRLAATSGDMEQALPLFQESLTLSTEQHDSWQMVRTLPWLAGCNSFIGKYELNIHYNKQSIAICEATGDMNALGVILGNLADALRAKGEYQEALQIAQRSLAVNRAADFKHGVAESLKTLGELTWSMGDFAAAQHYAAESLALYQDLGLTRSQYPPLVVLGNAACGLGDYHQARTYFHTVLRAYQQAGTLNTSWDVADATSGLANVFAKEGRTAQAVELLILVLHYPSVSQETRERAMRLLAELVPEMPSQDATPARPLDVVVSELLNE